MAFTFHELPKSRESSEDPRKLTLHYVAGRGDHAFIRAYAIGATPALAADGLYRQDVQLKPLGGGMFNVDVFYGPVEPPEPGSYAIRWEAGGQTVRRTHALEHIQSYAPAGETAPDHGGAINVQPDGRVEGVDVPIPVFKWTEDHQLATVVANWNYALIVNALYGKTNDATFRSLPAGTVRFDGATGGLTNQDPDKVDLSFSFTYSPAATGLSVDEITAIAKDGWEYAWTEYEQIEDTTSKTPAGRAIAVHVERVLDEADFGLLQIGS